MLDTPSLRVAFGVVALSMSALFYCVTYRSTRSAYAAWWCASLGPFVPGASLYLFNGTVNQVWANPLAGATADRATQVTDAIDDAMQEAARSEKARLPTVSYGIATVEDGVDLERTIGYADAALYRAKAAGRNRGVHYFPGVA